MCLFEPRLSLNFSHCEDEYKLRKRISTIWKSLPLLPFLIVLFFFVHSPPLIFETSPCFQTLFNSYPHPLISYTPPICLPKIVIHMLETLKTFSQVLVVQFGRKIMRVLLTKPLRAEYMEACALFNQTYTDCTHTQSN